MSRRGTARGRGQGVTPVTAAPTQNPVIDEVDSEEGEGGPATDAVPTDPLQKRNKQQVCLL